MAILNPPLAPLLTKTSGALRERDVLEILQTSLPDSYVVFHNVGWSTLHNGSQSFGEYDAVVLSPQGHVMIVEVKAGDVLYTASGLQKHYRSAHSGGETKDIGHQARRQHSSMVEGLKNIGIQHVRVEHLLVLADHTVSQGTVGYPRERIVDAQQLADLGRIVMRSLPVSPDNAQACPALESFLCNGFDLHPDTGVQTEHVRRTNIALADGLATWMQRISHPSGTYQVQATAGSGKSQLALALLRQAAQCKQKAMYVCFNHPLADTMAQLAPAQAQVNTFHGYCVDAARQMGVEPDFTHSGIFTTLAQSFMERSQAMEGTVELLIIDEAQDFDADWVQALLGHLAPQGRVYVLGDSQQDVYDKEAFDLPDAVHVQCMDNFRSPRKVVAAINSLHLAEQPIKACSAHEGVAPGFHTYANHDDPQKQTKFAGAALDACLKQLWADGFAAQDVALVTFAGHKHSPLLQGGRVDGHMLRAFTGTYDTAGNEIWTVGPLRAESLYRFKGQSAPVVVLCEVDFESVTPKVLRKLFVGFTRAQFRLEIVLSERAAAGLLERT